MKGECWTTFFNAVRVDTRARIRLRVGRRLKLRLRRRLMLRLKLRQADAADAFERQATAAHHVVTVSKNVLLSTLLPLLKGLDLCVDAAQKSVFLSTLKLVEFVDQTCVTQQPVAFERVWAIVDGSVLNTRVGPRLVRDGLGHVGVAERRSEGRCGGGTSHVELHGDRRCLSKAITKVSMLSDQARQIVEHPPREERG